MKKSKKQRKAETAKRLAGTIGKPKNTFNKFMEEQRQVSKLINDVDRMSLEIDDITRNYLLTDTAVKVDNPYLKSNDVKPDLYIVIAAIKDNITGKVYTGEPLEPYAGHTYIRLNNNLSGKDTTDGFLDNHRNFHNRMDSAKIAYNAGQCSDLCLDNGLLSTDYRHIGYFSVNVSEK